jgi:hypothetical protein
MAALGDMTSQIDRHGTALLRFSSDDTTDTSRRA